MVTDPASGAEPISEFLGPEAERLAREALAYALENAEDGTGSVPFAYVARAGGDRGLYRFVVGDGEGADLDPVPQRLLPLLERVERSLP